jgi:chromatin remodeling complex protein RSC6
VGHHNEVTEMKVLNIAQPNAHYVMFKSKNVENRSKDVKFRGTIAIYASKTIDRSRFEGSEQFKVTEKDCAFGCIIGFVDVTDSITPDDVTAETEEWFHGPYGYVFENVISLKVPIAVTPPQGAVIWWTLGGPDLQKCLEQIPDTLRGKMNPVPCEAPKAKGDKPRSRKAKVEKYDDANAPVFELSSALTKVVGQKKMKLVPLIEALWKYIKDNDLQDRKKKSIVHCDEKLKGLFGKEKVYVSEMDGILENHVREE